MNNSIQLRVILSSEDAISELKTLGADTECIEKLNPKLQNHIIRLDNISQQTARILKKEFVVVNGAACISPLAKSQNIRTSDGKLLSVFLTATSEQFNEVSLNLEKQNSDLFELEMDIKAALDNIFKTNFVINCGKYKLELSKRTYIMGILNVTPDSFSDGNLFLDPDAAIQHAKEMVANGADIIDIGGESTRPGSQAITISEEKKRVMPVLERLID